jgi:ribose transport system ATP-binding protein
MSDNNLLEITNVSKSFFGVTVFADFDFIIKSGEVHCLCGENGAGKSTFIKILSGAYQPDTGEIVIDGKKVEGKLSPALSMELGIETIYQEHTLMRNMTVMENLFVGKEITNRLIVDRREMNRRTREILKSIGVTNIDPSTVVRNLGPAQQKFVEIAKAFVKEAKIIIMDEPTASFGAHEIDQLLNMVATLKQSGIGIIYISHHLEEVFRIADRVTVIRDGRKIRTYDRAVEKLDEAAIIKDMVGRDASLFYARDEVEIGDVIMEVKNLSGPGVNDVSFNLHKGEILGFAGLVGAGRTELAELLFGRRKAKSGEVFINGKKIKVKTPKDAIEAGMCMVTEDRQLTGLFIRQKISLNAIIAQTVKRGKKFINPKFDWTITKKYIDKLRVKCKGPDQKVCYLSGGNQQKIAFCKWFITDGEVFIFDEPTRGVDIGAKEEIYHLMVQLCREGKSILMISSDMPEVIAMSDRVMIMKNNGIIAEIQKQELDSETILQYALGGSVK